MQTNCHNAYRLPAALGLALLVSLHGGAASAQSDAADTGADALDLTMTLLPEGATAPDAVTRTIELPDPAALRADPPGLDRADEAREQRGEGLDRAAEARERGREFGQEIARQAQEGRENAGRGPQPELPDPVPDAPGPPEGRGPPD